MSDVVIVIVYDGVKTVSEKCMSMSETIKKALADLQEQLNVLKQGERWVGFGADEFYSQMLNETLPRLQKAQSGLQKAAEISTTISQEMQTGEDNACACIPAD